MTRKERSGEPPNQAVLREAKKWSPEDKGARGRKKNSVEESVRGGKGQRKVAEKEVYEVNEAEPRRGSRVLTSCRRPWRRSAPSVVLPHAGPVSYCRHRVRIDKI